MDASDAEEFSEVASKPLRSLPYDSPAQTYVAFEKPEGVLSVGKFSNVLRFIVKEVDVPLLTFLKNESLEFLNGHLISTFTLQSFVLVSGEANSIFINSSALGTI